MAPIRPRIILVAHALIAVGQDDARARCQGLDVLEVGEIGDLERQQRDLLLGRDLPAGGGAREHLSHRLVRVDLGRILRDLYRDIAGEAGAGHDHRIALHRGIAGLAAFGGEIGKASGGLDLVLLDAARPAGIGIEGAHDLAIGGRRQLGDQHLDVAVLALEARKGLGRAEADQRHHAETQAGWENDVGGEGRKRCYGEEGERGEGADQLHGHSDWFTLRPFDGRPPGRFVARSSCAGCAVGPPFSRFGLAATGRAGLRVRGLAEARTC
ncbi:hypothetical protein ACVWYQ_004689 [Bradyrhizobium sp. USDA 3397]